MDKATSRAPRSATRTLANAAYKEMENSSAGDTVRGEC